MSSPALEFLKRHNLLPATPVAATIAACSAALLFIGSQDVSRVVAQPQATPSAPVVVAQATTSTKPSSDMTAFTPEQKKAIEGLIREYLINHPEVLVEAQQALEAKQEAQRAVLMKQAMSTVGPALFRSPSSPIAGAEKGEITVVEFFDYNCGYCKRAMPDVAKLIEGDKKVKFVFKELPIFGKDSEAAARVALAASKQGKYFELHRALLEYKGKVDEARSLELAKKLGLDIEKLKKDMAAADISKEIIETRQLAEKLGIQGTPHFFVADKVIPGAPENLHEVLTQNIAEVRKAGGCKVC
ncbi:MAG: DsbA family protein [Hyphomicrobiaceae bacterium]|nr:MAG: DsbA family protein [Hyphomicrobiaceae bacterium]